MRTIRSLIHRVLRKVLSSWVKTTVVGAQEDELTLDKDKPVIYALPLRSYSASLLVDSEVIKRNMPQALESLTIGNIELKSRVVFLSRPEGNLRRKRNMPYKHPNVDLLMKACEQDDQLDVQIVPVNVFWGREPKKEKSFLKLLMGDTWSASSRLRTFFTILFNGRNTFVHFNKPVSVRSLLDEGLDHNRALRKLGRVLRVHFRHLRTSMIGPDLSHRRTLVHRLVHKPMVKDAIEQEMTEKNISREKATARAIKYGDEIASNQSHTTIRFLDILLTWVWNKLYNGIRIHNLSTLQDIYQDNEIIYVPCHRSHIDYLLLSYVLYTKGIVPPQIAAGINLNMPVVGPILRRGGAFFMRRSFKGNALYSAVFDEYLHAIFTSGYSTEYFVEGGRSRTGRTIKPKEGMLAMTVRSFLRDSHKPIVFMPVYVGYEKVFEGSTYLGELRGKRKKKESISGIFKTLKDLKKNFGQVYLTFGDPIDLNGFLDGERQGWREEDHGADFRPDWARPSVNNLAIEVVTQINKAVALNPINMVSLALLATPRQAMDEQVLAQTLDAYKDLVTSMPYSHLTTLPDGQGQDWINYAERMNCIERMPHPLGDIINVDESQAVMLTYYRNNVLHAFAIPSMLACLFINNTEMKRTDIMGFAKTIYPYLKAELFLHWNENQVEQIISEWINCFLEKGYLTVKDGVLHRPAVSSNDFIMLSVLSELVIQILERYYLAISLLQRSGSGTLTQDQIISNCSLLAQRISILHGLNAPEFFDKALFKNLVEELLKRNVISLNSDETISFGKRIESVAADAKILLNADLRRSILQVTLNNDIKEETRKAS